MNAPTRTIVTVGPTIGPDQVRRHLPEAEIRGPVAADQILRWDLREGDRLLIIDGFFLQSRAVRHKEILALLDHGVQVTGASSMGALRAAELHDFGMRGVGSVFRAYRDEKIHGDDEVALLHADADAGYRPLTWALVDLRHVLGGARGRGDVTREAASTVVAAASTLPFTARDMPTVLAAAREHGVQPSDLAAVREACSKGRLGIKYRDAMVALRSLARSGITPPGAAQPTTGLTYRGVPVALAETACLRSWRRTQVTPPGPAGADHELLGAEDVMGAVALTWKGYPGFFRNLAARELLSCAPQDPHGSAPGPRHPGLSAGFSETWPALRDTLHTQLHNLGLPSSAAEAERHLGLLRPAERALPWQEAGPLLATRLWRSSSLLDWATPAIASLRRLPVFLDTHHALNRLQRAHRSSAPATEDEVRRTCRALLTEWNAGTASELLPALRERGFLNLADFVRSVRHHYAFLRSR
ncbi:TfuA-like protein [Streptomyces vinaceus]|uniref:TfuA-like protein n=1 Tax=Streptomyces vinaceus TaxID=1960 RepID=UPI0035DD3DF9